MTAPEGKRHGKKHKEMAKMGVGKERVKVDDKTTRQLSFQIPFFVEGKLISPQSKCTTFIRSRHMDEIYGRE